MKDRSFLHRLSVQVRTIGSALDQYEGWVREQGKSHPRYDDGAGLTTKQFTGWLLCAPLIVWYRCNLPGCRTRLPVRPSLSPGSHTSNFRSTGAFSGRGAPKRQLMDITPIELI